VFAPQGGRPPEVSGFSPQTPSGDILTPCAKAPHPIQGSPGPDSAAGWRRSDDLVRHAPWTLLSMGQGLCIDTVGIGLDEDTDLLRTLASESGAWP